MKRSTLIAVGVLVLILLLTSATFVGARMLRDSDKAENDDGGGGKVMELMTNDGSGPKSLRLKIEPSPELPDEPAEVSGILLRRQDNSMFVAGADIAELERVSLTKGQLLARGSRDHPGFRLVVDSPHDSG